MAAIARLTSQFILAAKVVPTGVNNLFRETTCPAWVLTNHIQTRERAKYKRRTTHAPRHWVKRRLAFRNEYLTADNRQFIEEVIADKYDSNSEESPLKDAPWPRGEWNERSIRTGVIARKIGIYPMWKKDGTKLLTTLLQIVDNHVIRYVPPDVYHSTYRYGHRFNGKFGIVIVGAERTNPQRYTQDYIGLFNEAGVMPKHKLSKFIVTPNAAVQPGTPLTAAHFRVGDYVDVYGKTIGRGFQGVMKRWGFKGGPASHGTTKAHRRPGTIGTGRQMARVWPGKKMPGHMGQERRTLLGLRIWRINTKYNVLWVHGPAVPGHVHHYVRIMDSRLPTRKMKTVPPFPTYYPDDESEPFPEDIYDPAIHVFNEPTLTFADEPDVVLPTASSKLKKGIRR